MPAKLASDGLASDGGGSYIKTMSQHDLPSGAARRGAAPILHRYDPQQPVAIPQVTKGQKAEPAATQSPSVSQGAGAPEPTETAQSAAPAADRPIEIGGPSGPEPTRYGDWERNGRVSDF
jgi:hypothetical protein